MGFGSMRSPCRVLRRHWQGSSGDRAETGGRRKEGAGSRLEFPVTTQQVGGRGGGSGRRCRTRPAGPLAVDYVAGPGPAGRGQASRLGALPAQSKPH